MQAAQQSLQAQLIGKAGVSELQAVAGRRSPRFPAAAAGSEGAPLSARGSPSHQVAPLTFPWPARCTQPAAAGRFWISIPALLLLKDGLI